MSGPGDSDTTLIKTNSWGIDLNYQDALGKWHSTSKDTVSALLAGMGAEQRTLPPEKEDSVIVMTVGERCSRAEGGTIHLETGDKIEARSLVPAALPLGYHRIHLKHSDRSIPLIVSPGKCWLPDDLRTWGWAVQLYAARSKASWGIGDFGDLEQIGEWSSRHLKAGVILLNPLSAATPTRRQQASPYFPTSRLFLNPLWIQIDGVPGAQNGDLHRLQALAETARQLNSERMIRRNKVFELKMAAFELLWLRFTSDPSFDAFCADRGLSLERFATFCALSERYENGWREWPEQYRHPASKAVSEFAAEQRGRLSFYKWLQWILDRQMARCAQRIPLMQDLPIGFDPDGADAWAWQDVLANNVEVGAPPDEFNTKGQNWGLPPFVPHKLRSVGYEPFIQTIRAAFRNGGGLRIDHVMGLFRLFCIPKGMSGAEGAYVRYNADEMLSIVALESQRARAYVVGEDLGTVEEGCREKLSSYKVMSYRLLWFENEPPSTYPNDALAAVTTHDLPTIAGLWSGSDLAEQRENGTNPNEEGATEIRQRLKRDACISDEASVEEVIAAAYDLLSQAPSRIVMAALDDVVAVKERPNMPATAQHANWCLALPIPIEELMQAKLPGIVAESLRRDASPRGSVIVK